MLIVSRNSDILETMDRVRRILKVILLRLHSPSFNPQKGSNFDLVESEVPLTSDDCWTEHQHCPDITQSGNTLSVRQFYLISLPRRAPDPLVIPISTNANLIPNAINQSSQSTIFLPQPAPNQITRIRDSAPINHVPSTMNYRSNCRFRTRNCVKPPRVCQFAQIACECISYNEFSIIKLQCPLLQILRCMVISCRKNMSLLW